MTEERARLSYLRIAYHDAISGTPDNFIVDIPPRSLKDRVSSCEVVAVSFPNLLPNIDAGDFLRIEIPSLAENHVIRFETGFYNINELIAVIQEKLLALLGSAITLSVQDYTYRLQIASPGVDFVVKPSSLSTKLGFSSIQDTLVSATIETAIRIADLTPIEEVYLHSSELSSDSHDIDYANGPIDLLAKIPLQPYGYSNHISFHPGTWVHLYSRPRDLTSRRIQIQIRDRFGNLVRNLNADWNCILKFMYFD